MVQVLKEDEVVVHGGISASGTNELIESSNLLDWSSDARHGEAETGCAASLLLASDKGRIRCLSSHVAELKRPAVGDARVYQAQFARIVGRALATEQHPLVMATERERYHAIWYDVLREQRVYDRVVVDVGQADYALSSTD